MSQDTRGPLIRLLQWIQNRWSPPSPDPSLDESLDAYDQVVKVVAVDPQDPLRGRILFRGTTWDAQSLDEPLVLDTYARIVARDNLCWLIHPDGLANLEMPTAPQRRGDATHSSSVEKRTLPEVPLDDDSTPTPRS